VASAFQATPTAINSASADKREIANFCIRFLLWCGAHNDPRQARGETDETLQSLARHVRTDDKPMKDDDGVACCNQCKLPLIEIDNRGERLTGCLTCNLWTAEHSKRWKRLSEEDVRALHLLRHG
jgi:hypothetical protein